MNNMESLFIPYDATTVLPTGNVLVLAPHPDDEVFGCGGAIMQHVAQRNPVTVIIVTDGQAATTHLDEASLLNYIKIRQQESRKASQILGYTNPKFWNIADRTLECNNELIQRLIQVIQQNQITQVYAPSVMEVHPDHYALAMLAVEAVKYCGDNVTLAMYEVGVPLYPNMLLDITSVLQRKSEAIACFNSQLNILDYSHQLQSLNGYRSYTLSPLVKAAEAYYVVDSTTLQQQPWRRFGNSRQNVELEEVYSKIKQLETTITQQSNELSTVYNSHSWRLTTPLRWLNSLMRKVVKK